MVSVAKGIVISAFIFNVAPIKLTKYIDIVILGVGLLKFGFRR